MKGPKDPMKNLIMPREVKRGGGDCFFQMQEFLQCLGQQNFKEEPCSKSKLELQECFDLVSKEKRVLRTRHKASTNYHLRRLAKLAIRK